MAGDEEATRDDEPVEMQYMPGDERNELETVVGKFLVAMIRIEGRIGLVLARYAGVADDRRAFLDDAILDTLTLRRKIEAFARVLDEAGLRDRFDWLVPELRKTNDLRNRFAHELPTVGAINIAMGPDNEWTEALFSTDEIYFHKRRAGKATTETLKIKDLWPRVNRIGNAVMEVYDLLQTDGSGDV